MVRDDNTDIWDGNIVGVAVNGDGRIQRRIAWIIKKGNDGDIF